MKRFIYFCVVYFLTLYPTYSLASENCVILLHGLGRTRLSMTRLASYLSHRNYIVINQTYPSTTATIETIATQHLPAMIKACMAYHPTSIHFVTHSMGGIVLRYYLATHKLSQLGHIVMLAPPNHGSVMADALHRYKLFHLILGPAAQELTTEASSTPNRLGEQVNYSVGVIAGSYNVNPLMWRLTSDINDGLVSVSSTKMSHMRDFEVLPVTHTFIMSNARVMHEVAYFLKFGKFSHR